MCPPPCPLPISPGAFGQSMQMGEGKLCVWDYSLEFAVKQLISSVFWRQRQELQAPLEFLQAQEHRGWLNSCMLCEAAEGKYTCSLCKNSVGMRAAASLLRLPNYLLTSQRYLECICLKMCPYGTPGLLWTQFGEVSLEKHMQYQLLVLGQSPQLKSYNSSVPPSAGLSL